MAELNHQLRDLIDAAATPVTPDEIRGHTLQNLGIPTAKRHRRSRWLAAAALLLVALAGSLLAATLAGRDDNAPTITDPNPTPLPQANAVEVVSDGVLYAVADGSATRIDTPRPIVATSDAAPTRTTYGLIALTDMRDGKGQLIRIDQGQVTDVVDDVYAFAVDPGGQLVAVARTSGIARDTGGRTTIEILDLATTATTFTVQYQAAPDEGSNASPVGWAGPYVMVNLRDGGGATAAYWRPGETSITTIGPGAVLATDPSGPRAFVAMGDSGCGTLFTILDGGGLTAEPPNPGTPDCAPSTISPDGAKVASIIRDTRALTVRTLQPPSPPTTITDTTFPGNGDVAWLDDDRIAVATNGRLTICMLPSTCKTGALPWTGPAPITIVRDRRAAGRSPTTTRPDVAATAPTPTTTDPFAADPSYARLYSRVDEPPQDFAVRFIADILGVATQFQSGEVLLSSPAQFSAVVRSTTGSVLFAVGMTATSDGRHRFDKLASPGLDWRGADGTAVIPEPGRLTITGFDGGLNPPGERMVTNLRVEQGSVTNLRLVESSWLSLELTTADGRTLRYLALRAA